MVDQPDRPTVIGPWRRILFRTWIVAGALVALIVLIGGPIVSADGADGTRWIAIASPIAMAIFILSALGWLALLITSRRAQRRPSTDSKRAE